MLLPLGEPAALANASPSELAQQLEAHSLEQVKLRYPELKIGQGIHSITSLWLVNAVQVEGTPSAIDKLVANREHRLDQPRAMSSLVTEKKSIFSRGLARMEGVGWGVEKIGAPNAWKQRALGQGIVVAVLDSGVNTSHPDLQGNLWTNPGETGKDASGNDKATNGLDDDSNGYADDVHGWNFEENSPDIQDYMGHGTQAAGTVAGNGASGLHTGVAPLAKIMVLRSCCQLASEVAEPAIWQALQYAMKNGAQVISMSVSLKHWGNPSYSLWRRAAEVFQAAGVVHVNSAGNRGGGNEPYNIGAPGSAPAAWLPSWQLQGFSTASMLTVGAVDAEDQPRLYSGQGPVTWESVPGYQDYPFDGGKKPGLIKPDICAPSETPSLSMDGNSYTASFGGTSSATPHVAGVVALILSAMPKLTVAQVTESILATAAPVGKEPGNRCGAGRVDSVAALKYAQTHWR